jgi:hypothetical protein
MADMHYSAVSERTIANRFITFRSVREYVETPRSERSALLHAAAFAAPYRSRDLSDEEMAQIRAAIRST